VPYKYSEVEQSLYRTRFVDAIKNTISIIHSSSKCHINIVKWSKVSMELVLLMQSKKLVVL